MNICSNICFDFSREIISFQRSAVSDQQRQKTQSKRQLRAGWLLVLGLVMVAGCIPARVPENLDDTPGPPVVVADHLYENSVFTARYPDGWRVVTSEASVPPGVIFVAPDETTTIQLSVGGLEAGNFSDPDRKTEVRGLTLADGTRVTAIYSAPDEVWETYLPAFEVVVESVEGVG